MISASLKETVEGERKFYNYKEAYRYCQERLKDLAKEEYMLDVEDPDDNYYYAHYFLVCELYRLTLKVNVFEEEYYEKERVLYFYWTGRRVIFSSGKKPRYTFERVEKIEEALNKGEEVEEFLKGSYEWVGSIPTKPGGN